MRKRSLHATKDSPAVVVKLFLSFLFISIANVISAQQKIIPLYNGAAPGSENWNWEEKTFSVKSPLNANVAYNVSKPTLTVFTPDTANGTAIVICPGGAFHVLNIEIDGDTVAKELNKKGITVFLFKYRVVQSLTDNPWTEMQSSMKDTAAFEQKIKVVKDMANEDVKIAMAYVRQHALEYNVDAKKIGIIGFSGGGGIARNMACNYSAGTRPDFVAIMYRGIRPSEKINIPADAPPLFIAAATDDILLPVAYNIDLYNAWIGAKRSAEIHIYSQGGHGLRIGIASTWITRFTEWLQTQGFLKPIQ